MSEQIAPGVPGANEIVALLEFIIAEARVGRVTSVGVISVTPLGGFNAQAVGTQAVHICTGATFMQAKIIEHLARQQQSAVIRN